MTHDATQPTAMPVPTRASHGGTISAHVIEFSGLRDAEIHVVDPSRKMKYYPLHRPTAIVPGFDCAAGSTILSEVNHQLESRMRETRSSGLAGGGTELNRSSLPRCASGSVFGQRSESLLQVCVTDLKLNVTASL